MWIARTREWDCRRVTFFGPLALPHREHPVSLQIAYHRMLEVIRVRGKHNLPSQSAMWAERESERARARDREGARERASERVRDRETDRDIYI
jgi:hypothetical protein